MEKEVYSYLKVYADAALGDIPNPSSEIIEVMREEPEEAFNVIADYQGKRPRNLDPRDMDAPLGRLLEQIADLVPELFISRMTSGYWASRYPFICSAAASKSEVFVPTILNLLADRSIYIKTLVLDLIPEMPHLQVPEALPKFERLEKMKSFLNSDYDKKRLEKAKAATINHITKQ